jgi:hypothetical protein
MDTEEARRRIDARWRKERGAVGRHVDSVIKRAEVLTDDERKRLAEALVIGSRAEQGLPPTVEDPAVLAEVARIISRTSVTP